LRLRADHLTRIQASDIAGAVELQRHVDIARVVDAQPDGKHETARRSGAAGAGSVADPGEKTLRIQEKMRYAAAGVASGMGFSRHSYATDSSVR
jgi:hypothetical protein